MEKIFKQFMKKNAPELRSGDTVKVHIKVKEGVKERVQIFEGLVIAVKHGNGLDGTFTVRKESFGIGVERVFPLHSPRIVKVERVKQSKVRQSKLYYMRELSGKNARLKDLNRDLKVWEEKGAEEELERIAAETAVLAEEAAAAKAAEEAAEEAKVAALAGDRIADAGDGKTETEKSIDFAKGEQSNGEAEPAETPADESSVDETPTDETK